MIFFRGWPQQFGEDRLISTIERNRHKPPAEICQSVFADINTFIGKQAAQDDQTMIIARLAPTHTQGRQSDFESALEDQLVGV